MGIREWIMLYGVGVGLIWIIVWGITSSRSPEPPKPAGHHKFVAPPEFEDEGKDD